MRFFVFLCFLAQGGKICIVSIGILFHKFLNAGPIANIAGVNTWYTVQCRSTTIGSLLHVHVYSVFVWRFGILRIRSGKALRSVDHAEVEHDFT